LDQSDRFWREFDLNINQLCKIIHLEYIIKIYCNNLQFKAKGDFLKKSLRRSNKKYFENLKTEFSSRIKLENSISAEILKDTNILAYLSFYHGCIFAVDFYFYVRRKSLDDPLPETDASLNPIPTPSRPASLPALIHFFTHYPKPNQVTDYLLKV
jgi:hypothetical protein